MARRRTPKGGTEGGGGGKQRFDLGRIQAAVTKAAAGWQAGATTMTALSEGDRLKALGLKVSEAEMRATEAAVRATNQIAGLRALAAPAAVDWRANGGNFITAVRDQQSCGSCVSFATLATIESRMNIVCRTPDNQRDYSEAYLFYCGCGNCCGTGWDFAPALDFCKTSGVAEDASFPYTPGNQPCKAGVTPLFKIQGHTTALSAADRKAAIADRGPVVAGMAVYQDFYAYRSGVYKHISGALAGYHAVSVIGYDDAQSCWIAKNSWGPGWGDAGFFRIAYGEAMMDTSFAFYEPQVVCETPDDCTRYVPILRRVILLARRNRTLRGCLQRRLCGGGPGIPCPPSYLAVVRGVAAILRKCPQYREPFCRAI